MLQPQKKHSTDVITEYSEILYAVVVNGQSVSKAEHPVSMSTSRHRAGMDPIPAKQRHERVRSWLNMVSL